MKLRPTKHFTPKYGWMNDPNGLILYKGRYHVFYQHNPHGLTWDRMHWGHAVTDDLVNFEHLPIALFPDEMGDIFSGCCFYDEENASGLGTAENPPLLSFYTSHNPDTAKEQQCVAVSFDGINFQKYPANPIIKGKNKTPARDPQVFKNPKTGGYSLCLTTEKEVEFYESGNLLSWEKTGAFRLPPYAFQGMIECPNLFSIKPENEEGEKQVLMISMDIPESEFYKFPKEAKPHSRIMQYFVGTFDGKTFVEENPVNRPLLVDYGPDFYAGSIFAGCDETIMMAWLGNSGESMKIPTEEEGFRGILSFPRKLSLVKIGEEYHLKHRFAFLEEDCRKIEDGCVKETISPDGIIAYTEYRNIGKE